MTEAAALLGPRVAVGVAASGATGAVRRDPPPKQHSGIFGCYSWYLDGNKCTKQKFTFLLYCLIGVLGIVFFIVYLTDESEMFNTGFILACSLAIFMSTLAVSGFRDVIRLQQTINKLVENTKELANQRDKIRGEVQKLKSAHNKLEEIERELESSSSALRTNFSEFKEWNSEIKSELEKNKGEAKEINHDFKKAIQQYHNMLVQNELAIADKAFHHVLAGRKHGGLNKMEFQDLLLRLPPRWKATFDDMGKSFEDFAGDDHQIDQSEFSAFMRAMAKQIANCGMSRDQLKSMGLASRDDDRDDEKRGN